MIVIEHAPHEMGLKVSNERTEAIVRGHSRAIELVSMAAFAAQHGADVTLPHEPRRYGILKRADRKEGR